MKATFLGVLSLQMALAAGMAFVSSGCGKNEPAPPKPRRVASLTAEERASYCFLEVAPEKDPAARAGLIAQLKGSWQHYPVPGAADPSDTRRTFKFDTDRNVVTISRYETFTNIDDLAFVKLCISQPLDASMGAYAGFRIIEMMAKDNAGGAALAVKIDPAPSEGESPVLSLSDYHYERFAAKNDTLGRLTPATFQYGSESGRIWTYPSHKE